MRRRWVTFWRIVHTGTVNFLRNASLAIAAMAVMIITLTIILFSWVTNATFTHSINSIESKIDISVFLQDSVTDAQAKTLVTQLRQQPNVENVQYLDKAQALQAYIQQNAGNQTLISAASITGNPIPATIIIKPVDLNKIGDIKTFLTTPANLALQTQDSPSYSGDRQKAIDNITHATDILRKIGIAAVIIFALVSALIIFNTIQMAIFNRRDELKIMRLLGATPWYVRGPFVVESIIYGLLSAVISILIIYAAFGASANALQASSLGLLDINYANQYFGYHFLQLLGVQMALGIVLGAGSSIIATRRYLKVKTK